MAEYMTTTTRERERQNEVIGRDVNYHAVFTGVITALGLELILNVLGNAIGISELNPVNGNVQALSAGPVLYTLFIPLACFLIGGFAAAAVSRSDSSGHGALLGWLVWALGMVFLGGLIALNGVAAYRNIGAQGSDVFWLLFFSMCLALIGGVFGGYLGSKPLHRSVAKEHERYVRREVTT